MQIIRYKLKDGTTRYLARVRLEHKPEKSQGGFTTKEDAKRWGNEVERAQKLGHLLPDAEKQRRTVADAIDRWLTDKLADCAESDRANVRQMLDWWRGEIGKLQLLSLSPDDVIKARDKLRDAPRFTSGSKRKGPRKQKATPRSDSRVNRYTTTLSRVMGVAKREWRWADDNPCSSVKKLGEPKGRVRFLSGDEIAKLWELVEAQGNPLFTLFVRIALATGARRSEVAGLEWRDVDLSAGRVMFRETKNGDDRSCPLPAIVVEEIKRLRASLPAIPIATARIFPAGKSKRPESQMFAAEWRKVQAHFTAFRFHDTRHTAASYAAMAGASPLQIAEMLGHNTLEMVKRYAHLSDDSKRALVERVSAQTLATGSAK